MNRFVRLGTLLCLTIALLAAAPPARAQEAKPDLANAYAAAMQDFQAGDYAHAASALEALVARVAVTPEVEPIFYTIGSAYFNAGDYPKAIAAFKNYQAKFPAGPHAAGVAFAIAQSNFLSKNYREAAAQMAALANDPKLREEALLFQGEASKAAGKIDDAIGALEQLAGREIKSPTAMWGATLLAQLLAGKGDGARALQILELIHRQIALVDNVVELNTLTVQLGDKFYGQKQFQEALACYRFASPRAELVRLQNDRIAAMQRQVAQNLAATRAHPAEITQLAPVTNQLKEDIARAQKLLAEFEKLPSITPAIYLRLGRCFYELDRKWEAIVVDQEILDRFPDGAEREPALFGIILALAEVDQPQRAEARCEQYLRDFKEGPNVATVGYLLGAVALQAGDAPAAEGYFNRILTAQPQSKFREQIRYLLGNAKFIEGDYAAAIAAYQDYLKEFPKGASVEEVRYRIVLGALFAGKYEAAMKQLQEFIAQNPQSSFLPDAKYRLAVCKYAAALYDEVIADCQAWEKEFGNHPQLGEVLALRGDAYAASDREGAAVPIYIRSYQTATSEEVLNYSLTAASKLLQKQGEWDQVAALFTAFLKEKPDNPAVVTAIYWIGKAKAHEGKIDEAKTLAAETIKRYIDDPNREAVEQLISQLARFCVKKKQPVEAASDPGAELARLLSRPEGNDSPTARARLLFAQVELARLRHAPAEAEKNLAKLATDFKPEDLSPLLLGEAGDYLLSQGKLELASGFYQYLLDDFPKSQMADFAFHGLGEIAYAKHEYPKALRYYNEGLEKNAASQKLKEISVGRAKTLLALGQLDEAQKAFEQVASVRAWRGESTAFSVYSLGAIAAQREKWAEANAYFQRVYVGYQKYLPWVAKAYMGSGESFEKLGKKEEAGNTYRELLRNQKLANFTEAAEARKRLQALGQG